MQLPSCKNLWPSLNGFIGKFGHKNQKSLQKNQFFELIDLKTIFEGQGTPIFFCFANIRCLEVLKKVSGHTSIKWLRYHHFKRRGKTEKCQKWSFLVIFKNNWTQKGVPFILIHSWGHYKM